MFESLKTGYKMARMTTEMYMNAMESKFLSDTKGEGAVNKLIYLFIVAVLAGALIPTAMTSLKAANSTGWTTSEVATYGIITIMILIAVVLLIVKIATE